MGEQSWVASVGYEGETLDGLIKKLKAWNVTVLVDVRLNPISRKRGFSKTALTQLLAQEGITYLHRPSLGNPKDNRDGFAERGSDLGDAARERFRSLLENNVAQSDLADLADLAAEQQIAVMCFESSELHCHRQQVLRELYDRLDRVPA